MVGVKGNQYLWEDHVFITAVDNAIANKIIVHNVIIIGDIYSRVTQLQLENLSFWYCGRERNCSHLAEFSVCATHRRLRRLRPRPCPQPLLPLPLRRVRSCDLFVHHVPWWR